MTQNSIEKLSQRHAGPRCRRRKGRGEVEEKLGWDASTVKLQSESIRAAYKAANSARMKFKCPGLQMHGFHFT